ncbi:MAG TPA: hypothetical protein PLJ27_07505 [Polyangiaceae bacterium]|jgi:hypothetical protein|nr:MAG: hypothetical protein BWY17_03004 [Deltaproteobacteria bacterium ADurb.Bin207]HNS96994.1 hypothetical protein [Polyangiaceae bacterium]HNZ21961.1 hypothetical protein [Polyangiaceae bacterium]HOD23145.1 hypothetical protein [Polyangiaceae bacterium]HOE50338.1 hypothetical protein [Polyangiaceae bacterium]
MRLLPPLALSLVILPGLGCSAEGAVSLTGSIGNVHLGIEDAAFVSTLQGGFDVYLELGERASGPSNITFLTFSLVNADSGSPVLSKEHLSVVSSKSTPLTIQPGNNATIHFDIGDQSQPGANLEPMELSKEERPSLCGANRLQIIGTIQDSADGARPSTLTSVGFSPTGCP